MATKAISPPSRGGCGCRRRWIPGRLQLIGFFDTGHIRGNEKPWIAGPNTVTRSGAGVGLTWAANDKFVARVSYAHAIDTGPATSVTNSSSQFWFELVKFF